MPLNWKSLLTNPFKKKEEAAENDSQEVPSVKEAMEVAITSQEDPMITDAKLTEEQRLDLVDMIGKCYTHPEIHHLFKVRHGRSISASLIYKYKQNPKWKALIKQIRKEHLLDTNEVDGAHKRVRLERAERLYSQAYGKGDVNNALKAIEHQRKEVEEKGQSVSLTFNQYNTMPDEELEERRNRYLSKLKKAEVIDVRPDREAIQDSRERVPADVPEESKSEPKADK